MGEWDLNFEPADLADVVWLAVLALVLLEAARYVIRGRRPASTAARAIVAALAAITLGWLAISGRLKVSHISHGWACLILAVLLLPWLVRSYRTTTRPLAAHNRLILLTLRVAAAGIALLMIARPVAVWSSSLRERASVGILLDTSRSMNVRDIVPPRPVADTKIEPVSRLETVQAMFEASRDALHRLEESMDVQFMTFDARLRRVNEVPDKAEGGLTAVGRNLDRARDLLVQTGARIAGLILISDGRDTSSNTSDPLQAGDELAMAGVPLYCVGVGNEVPQGETRSLTPRRLDMPDRVGVLNRLSVGAEFLAAGLVGVPVEVRLDYDGEKVGSQIIKPTQVHELIRADLSHVFTEGGLHQVTVVATAAGLPAPQGEARLSRYVRVTDDKVQVLYIDRPRYERAAVARALDYAQEINLTKIDLDRPADAPAVDLLPAAPEAWRIYHVVIIGDVAPNQIPDDAMQSIAGLVVSEGRGAAILGGVRSLGSGDYAGTPFHGLFPVDLAARGQIDGAVPFEITPAGKLHPCCQSGGQDDTIWSQMPPFAGASRLGQVAPAAEVLIRTTSGAPLMVVRQTRAGRTAALAFDSTWQWPFAGDAGLELHRRFWRQLVLWLANRRPEVWVLPERSQYDLTRLQAGDEQVVLRAGINEPTTGGLPAQSAITGEIVAPDGRTTLLVWTAAGDGFEARPTIDQPGEYKVRVQGSIANQPVGQAEAGFIVESVDREMSEPFADLESLERLAARTASIGGQYIPTEQFSQLLERIRASSSESRITRAHRHYLVDDHPWFWLAAFIGMLAMEWIVRRRLGLV
ncbi:MAG TPA: VWA domain-containing protein [Phycisphaerae bacterium]|nr:VWA domain-containing protein [Phycisphaerae bacterium]HOQ87987.1 VWA domain-containing protein [Phycisphaerae bacterium]